MTIFKIVATLCLLSDPTGCAQERKINLVYLDPIVTPFECLSRGMQEIARLYAENPSLRQYRVERIGCVKTDEAAL